MRNPARTAAEALGRGLVAGLVGTAAMTVSSTIEAKLSGRGSSSTPAEAAGKVAGVEPRHESGEQRFNSIAHWGYGSSWGVARAVLGLVGLSGPAATAAHFGAVWGAEQAVLPALDVAAPTWSYGGQAVATDVLHHAVYAAVAGVTYDWLAES